MDLSFEHINSCGNANIRIRMYEGRNVLFYKKEILSVYFSELEHSCIHYFAGTEKNLTNESLQALIEDINHGEITQNDSLKLSSLVLGEFENGTYNITFDSASEKVFSDSGFDADASSHWVEKTYGTKITPDYFIGKYSFLGEKEHHSILETSSRKKLDHSRIAYYKDIISKGKQPIVILFGIHLKNTDMFEIGRDDVYYLIDGHHKMAAYKYLNQNPRVLRIQQVINQDNFDEFYMNKEEYQKYKEHRGSLHSWVHYLRITSK